MFFASERSRQSHHSHHFQLILLTLIFFFFLLLLFAICLLYFLLFRKLLLFHTIFILLLVLIFLILISIHITLIFPILTTQPFQQPILLLVLLPLPQLLINQRADFTRHSLKRHTLDLHAHAQLPVMCRTVQMSNVRHIALEPLTADVAVEHLSHFLLLVRVDLPHVLLDVQTLVTTDQHALVAPGVDDRGVLGGFLFGCGLLGDLLQSVLLPPETVDFCSDAVDHFLLVLVGHLGFCGWVGLLDELVGCY